MERLDFEVLYEIYRNGYSSQRSLANRLKVSVGSVNAAIKSLRQRDLINSTNAISSAGVTALEPYKVNNAVIMAAGLSSRFAPISYERPKGLLRVKGEILIERQIRQLREAGVKDIAVVVGYKQEQFFYLEEKLGVDIIVNAEYRTRNNNSTIHVVRDRLANSYICCSDNYFTDNPFESHVYDSYYSAIWAEGETDEWCLTTTGRDALITDVEIGGKDAWVMAGHVYWSKKFSKRFVEILEDVYDEPQTAGLLWESIYLDHMDELPLYMRKYDNNAIREFDSVEDLRDFDPEFINNVDLEIFDNITHILGCERADIKNIVPLKKGMMNLSFYFSVNDKGYVYRHPGIGTELLIDRKTEAAAQNAGNKLGFDHTYLYQHPSKGWKISHYVEGYRHLDPHNDDDLNRVFLMMRQLHASEHKVDNFFDFWEAAKEFETILLEYGPIEMAEYEILAADMKKLAHYVMQERAEPVLCHNDFSPVNVLVDKQGNFSLIDWEYAGMGDPANDFGTFCVTSEYSEEEVDRAMNIYCEGQPSQEEYRHNLAYIAFAGWAWYLWSLVKEAEGDHIGEYLYLYYKYAKKYMRKSLALYQGE
ncbi:MAG: phosphotransferase [Actinomycetaceae bacterium]|nr:phosphotransferase [Actinomycetaceae bacterium]